MFSQVKQNRRTQTGRALVLLGAFVVLGGCARQMVATETTLPGGTAVPSVGGTPNTVGAATGRAVVENFLKAVNAQDLQGMSALWGNAKGLARDQYKREEIEKRLIIMQCLMQHETHTYPDDRPRLQTGGKQEHIVDLTKGKITVRTTIVTVVGPGGRHLVEDVDVSKLKDFCQ